MHSHMHTHMHTYTCYLSIQDVVLVVVSSKIKRIPETKRQQYHTYHLLPHISLQTKILKPFLLFSHLLFPMFYLFTSWNFFFLLADNEKVWKIGMKWIVTISYHTYRYCGIYLFFDTIFCSDIYTFQIALANNCWQKWSLTLMQMIYRFPLAKSIRDTSRTWYNYYEI